jgi:peptidoglycan-associated lipoprotein
MEMNMNALKMMLLPVLVATVAMTGCASKKPATTTTVTNQIDTTGLSEDATLNAQNLQGASSKGVTAANRAALAKRVVYFDYDSSSLSNADIQTLQGHAQFLMANANSRVALAGHTDERGTREYNMALGERRAKAVESFLVAQGVNAAQLEAVSYGKEMPVNLGHNEAAWKENRRVEINYEAVPPLLK